MYTRGHGAYTITGNENAEWKLDIPKYTGDDEDDDGGRGPTVRETRAN